MALMQVLFTTFAGYNLIAYGIIKISWAFFGYHFYLPEVAVQHATPPFTYDIFAIAVLLVMGFSILIDRYVQVCSWGAIGLIVGEHILYHNSYHELFQYVLIAGLITTLFVASITTAIDPHRERNDGLW